MTSKNSFKFFPIALVAYETAAYLSNDMYLPALPQMAHNFSISAALVQLTVTAWLLGSSIWQLILGPLSDTHGRRKIFLWGGGIFVLSTLICALSPSYSWMMWSRFVQGSTVCIILVCGYSTIHELYSTKMAIQIISWMMGITLLAPAFGPLLGAVILYWWNWRWIFGFLTIFAAMIWIMLYWFMPESELSENKKLNFSNILRQYWAVLKDPRFLSFTSMGFLIVGAIVAWIVAAPMLIIQAYHYSINQYCLMQVLVFGSFILGTYSVKFLINKNTPIQLVKKGIIIILIAGVAIIPVLILSSHKLLGLISCLMLYCFGAAIGAGSAQRLALEDPRAPMGATMAVFSTINSAGAFVGSLLVSVFPQHNVWPLGIIFFVVSLIIYALFRLIVRLKIADAYTSH